MLPNAAASPFKPIRDYGIIGNSRTAAMVGPDGGIDWLCLPDLDSPSVFAALLDPVRGGRFALCPEGSWDSVLEYLPQSNVLKTTFRVPGGLLAVTDFMPMPRCEETETTGGGVVLYRKVEVDRGKVGVKMVFAPRFDYARAATSLALKDGVLEACGAGLRVALASAGGALNFGRHVVDLRGSTALVRWRLAEGDCGWLMLHFEPNQAPLANAERAQEALDRTLTYWRDWLNRSETGHDRPFGLFREGIERSALVLKTLQYEPTGALAAAVTTSLPEEIGGVRNWDYRYSWVRDSALTVEALYNTGHLSEMEGYLRWLKKIICESGSRLQILYGLRGETLLPEQDLPHLQGYKGSAPVRIGNAAHEQQQLDIYGEIMDAALRLSNYAGKIDFSLWPFLQEICETALRQWHEKDYGIWEVRGGPYHFVYSKVMCWVALDRGITIAKRYGFPADLERWEEHRRRIRDEILRKGWSGAKKAFVQHYETEALDASVLLLPFYDFLSYDDPRMVSTVAAVQRELADGPWVYRYRATDGLPGREGVFLVCSFWLIDNLIGQGRLEEAQAFLLRLEKAAGPLGLFSEEYDPRWRESLGNFPQAFTHIGYINTAVSLCRAQSRQQRIRPRKSFREVLEQKVLLHRSFVLNRGSDSIPTASKEIVRELKQLMNRLRGAYFRTAEGRVAYEEMAESAVYREYVACSRHLDRLDLESLATRQERLALWINLFNVLVIHGVVALGIRDSVKEVPRFFRRIQYRVGGFVFSADDIEHGILRGNHRLPRSFRRSFGKNDPRTAFALRPMDPRIHFALVCASLSCPPIDIYSPENLEEQLTISGKTFLNAGGIRIDRKNRKVHLSKVFKWYGEDFGATAEDRLRFAAPYLYDESDRRFLEENLREIKIAYDRYDWRLNRTG